jgi:hypothetical protein
VIPSELKVGQAVLVRCIVTSVDLSGRDDYPVKIELPRGREANNGDARWLHQRAMELQLFPDETGAEHG